MDDFCMGGAELQRLLAIFSQISSLHDNLRGLFCSDEQMLLNSIFLKAQIIDYEFISSGKKYRNIRFACQGDITR
jgi:hypothetical protein